MNNVDFIDNSTIYLLDNSTYIKYDKNLFDIFGSIKIPQPIFENKYLLVIIYIESDKKLYTEVENNIANITGHNQTLFCQTNETLEDDLYSEISFINNHDILHINFGANNDSKINIDIKRIFNRIYYRNKEGDNTSTAIAIITIVIIIAILLLLVYALFKKKQNKFKIK